MLLDQAMALSAEERAELAAHLLRSLEPDDELELSDEEWREAWAAEIERRLGEVRNGSVKLIDGDEALRTIRARLAARRP
jgi:putative addiction module component (TIGR02574 family)